MKSIPYYLLFLFMLLFFSCKKEVIPATPITITGSSSICPNDSGEIYSIAAVDGANYYTWTVPQDAIILSGQGTTTITVAWGSTSGNICVRSNNKTSTSEISCIYVNQGGGKGVWCQERNFQGQKRNSAVAFSLNGKGYVTLGGTGGGTSQSECLKDMWEFDPTSNTWIQKADFGGDARYYAVSFTIGEKAYVGTGWNVLTTFSDFWKYDPSNNTWNTVADFGGNTRTDAFVFSIGNYAYVGAGVDENGEYKNDFWEYDPSNDSWTEKTALPASENYTDGASFSIGDKGYLGTGYDGYEQSNPYKGFWEFAPNDTSNGFDFNNRPMGKWTKKNDFGGVARSFSTGFSINGKGYIGLGQDMAEVSKKDIWEYDPTNDSWTKKNDFGGHARNSAVSFVIDSCVYIGTGYINSTTPALNDFWVYKP